MWETVEPGSDTVGAEKFTDIGPIGLYCRAPSDCFLPLDDKFFVIQWGELVSVPRTSPTSAFETVNGYTSATEVARAIVRREQH